jgi:hypothetical protein
MSPQTTPRLHADVGGTAELEFKLAVAAQRKALLFPASRLSSKLSPAASLR